MIQEVPLDAQNLQQMRSYFQTGATRSYAFRREQLQKLATAIKTYESEIFEALHSDLRKSKEESYATETGLVLAEISYTLKRLRKWMKPKRVKTNLLNFPSSTRIYPEPLGLALIIGSWNYPFQLTIMPLIGAIAGGNCAVLKPSEVAPATSRVIAKMIGETYAAEYVQVVEGEGSEAVPALMNAIRFDHIFYTGSASVGRAIYEAAARQLIPVTLELGGKSPAIVEKDADIKTTARRIVMGKYINAGQTCVAPDYVLVHAHARDKLLHELKHFTSEFFGENASESADYGRLINERRFDKLMTYMPQQEQIVFGGEHDREELFIGPTVVKDVSVNDPIMKEEIFGPILPVISFENREEALEIVNQNEKPLSFYVFTSNADVEAWWMDRVSFGSGCVNNTILHLSNPNLPFGGVGDSGLGAYHGKHSFDTFTHAKAVMKTPVWFDPKMKYPPFKGKLGLFKKMIR